MSALELAVRDLRGSVRTFIVLVLCLLSGTAIIAVVGQLEAAARATIDRDSRALLGGEVEIEVVNRALRDEELSQILVDGARLSRLIETNGLVRSQDGRRIAVSIKAVDERYPLFGEVALEPTQPLAAALDDDGIVLEPAALERLGASPGDRLRFGEIEVPVTAALEREPDRLGVFFEIGPRALMSLETLENAGILAPGALARWIYRIDLPDGLSAERFMRDVEERFPRADWQMRGYESVAPSIARFTDRLSTFLTLAGLAALIVGGLGIAITINAYIASRRSSIAVMRCIGAKQRDLFVHYGLQMGVMITIGILSGLLVAQALAFAITLLPGGVLPLDLRYAFHPRPALMAAACGLLAAMSATFLPLITLNAIRPSALWRLESEGERRPSIRSLILFGLCLALFVAVCILSVERRLIAAYFMAALIAAFVVIALLARLLLAGLGRMTFEDGGILVMALKGLKRADGATLAAMTALGGGLTVLVALAVVERSIAAEVAGSLDQEAPRYVMIDIQPAQREAFRRAIEQTEGGRILQMLPSLRARVVGIDGGPVVPEELGEEVRWTVRRDRGLTYQERPAAGEVLVEGSWWPHDYKGEPLVSIDEEIAEGYGVGLGASLTFNILGREMTARIANIRAEIDWSGGRLAFLFVMNPSALEDAPHTWIAAVDTAPEAGAGLLDRLARELPNVTPVSVGSILTRVADTIAKVALLLKLVAGVTAVSGLIVLVAATLAAGRERARRTVLMKVVGATRRDILFYNAAELVVIGATAGLSALLLGSAVGYVVVRWVLDLSFGGLPLSVAIILLAAIALTLAIGLTALARSFALPAAAILRER